MEQRIARFWILYFRYGVHKLLNCMPPIILRSQDEFPIRKVTFAAKAEHESIKNYKVLQQFFGMKGVTKHVDVEKLMKGKPMDNLEFLQWLKGFYDEQCTNLPYDALARRRGLGYQPAAAATFRPSKPTSASRSAPSAAAAAAGRRGISAG
jgi:RP/EB family microtubule-associated protein